MLEEVAEEDFPRKRAKVESGGNDAELCLACATHPAAMTQQECGHCVLCPTCAFRIYAEDRRCPSCRSAMLFPLVLKADVSAEPFSPSVTTTALRYAEEAVTAAVGSAGGVLQSLKAVLPRIPAETLPRWFTALKKTCKALKRVVFEAVASIVMDMGTSCSEDVRQAAVEFLAGQGDDPTGTLQTLLGKAFKPVRAAEPGGLLLRALELDDGLSSGIASVVTALRLFPGDRAVAQKGAAAIEGFCNDADAEGLGWAATAGCVEAVTQAMLAHPRCMEVQRSGCRTIVVLLRFDDCDDLRVARPAIAAAGLAAAAALRAHPSQAQLVLYALGAMAKAAAVAGTTGIVAAGGVGLAIAAMQQHAQDGPLQISACGTFFNCAEALTAAEATRAVDLAAAAVSAHADNPFVVGSVCMAVERIIMLRAPLGKHLLLTAPDTLTHVVNALPGIAVAGVSSSAIDLFARLCSSRCPDGREKVAAAGAGAAAKAAAAKHADDADVQTALAALESALRAPPP